MIGPPMNGKPPGMQMPLIELGNCGLQVGAYPANPELKAIIIGPIFLAVPLNEDGIRQVVDGLTGILIAGQAPPAPERSD